MEEQQKIGEQLIKELQTSHQQLAVRQTTIAAQAREDEGEKSRLLHNLNERIKELTTLYRAAHLLQDMRQTTDEIVQELVMLLPAAWQYPDITAARILLDGKEYLTPQFAVTPWVQRAEFTTVHGTHGSIEIVYKEERPIAREGPFLLEERHLLDSVAEMLQSHLARQWAEAARQHDEALFRALAENSLDLIVILEADGTIRYVSPSHERVLGYTIENLQGKDAFTLVHPDEVATLKQIFASKLATLGATATLEFRYRHKDGSWRTFEGVGKNLLDDPVVRGVIINSRDITERKQAEEMLSRQQHFSEALLKAQSDLGEGLIITEGQHIVYANEAACQISGYSVEELRALSSFLELVVPEERVLLADRLRQRLSGQQVLDHYETAITHKQGHHVALDVAVKLLPNAGRPQLVVTARNITERKRAEETLQKERDFIAAVLDTTSALVVVVDLQGRIVRFNRACEQLTGYTFEEVQGKDIRKLFLLPEEGTAVAEAVFNKRQKSDFPNCHINHWVAKTGDCRLISWSNTVLCDDSGRLEYIIGTGIDITERQQAEAEKQQLQQQLYQAQKLEALGTLAGGVAHDFNNLLSVMLGFTELACDEVPEESAAYQNLQEVVKASRRARALVRQLLTFSRSTTAERRAVYLKPVVEETLAFLRASLPPNVEIQSQIAEGGWEIWADPTQVQQVVLNLCINGAQAMAGRGGRLTVSVQPVDLETPLESVQEVLE